MKQLKRFEKYSRKDIHDIFSPDTKFTPHSGSWGMHGIVKIPYTEADYVFLVTYGRVEAGHVFDERIDENGILTWQSQPKQTLSTPLIKDFIQHDYQKNNIYLFLRNSNKEDYSYMGLLAYVEHDSQREKPVYFKWQILDWDASHNLDTPVHKFNLNDFSLFLNEDEVEYSFTSEIRKGKDTNDFSNSKNIDFEGEIKKNTELGNMGEDLIVEYEKNILISAGRKDLAKLVCATRNTIGNTAAFDILSYDVNGNIKYIEVKSTKGGFHNIFHISENEVSFSELHPDNYYLYRIFNFNSKAMSANLSIIKGPVSRRSLQPTNYSVQLNNRI